MSKTLRMITRSGMMSKLQLWSTTPTPRNGSPVHTAITTWYDEHGDKLGEHTVELDAIGKGWNHEFRVLSDTAEADEAHSGLWL